MKHTLFSFFLAFTAATLAANAGTININGKQYPVDTIEHYMTGPGVDYVQFNVTMGSTIHKLYLLDVDLTNPYNSIEEHQSGDKMGKTEKLVASYSKMNSVEHRTIGGVNCNFWVVSGNITQSDEAKRVWSGLLGQPFSGTAHGGVLIGDPSENWNRGRATSNPDKEVGFVMIDNMKRVFMDDMRYVASVTHNGNTHMLRDCNRTRENPDNDELVIFNHYTYKDTPSRTVNNGTEVVVRLKDQWAINRDLHCEVTDVNSVGGTKIDVGYAILQGRGSGKAFLDNIKKGDDLTIHLGVVNRTDSTLRPDIREMVTGNCLVMENGELTIRNTNEDYNNRNYPRTMLATNNEGNRFWMLVSATPGNYTAEMCGILKNSGATYAVGMDGGGSAQMCLNGAIQNQTTESSPRAVANSIWVFSTAPDDSIAATLSSSTKQIRLPKYSIARPVFNVYNQYGALIYHDYNGVTLSCDPATGTITDDGAFLCLGSGILTATHGNAKLDIPVVCESGSEPAIVLDTVWIDNRWQYQVEVTSRVDGKSYALLNSALTWHSSDENICSVNDDGVIIGRSNGTSTVHATLYDMTDSIVVVTEISDVNPLLLTDFSRNEDSWQPVSSSSASTLAFTPSPEGGRLVFSYKKSRSPLITFSNNIRLYSLPSAIKLTYDRQNFPLIGMMLFLQSRGAGKITCPVNYDAEGEHTEVIDISKAVGEHISIFPISVTGLRLQFDATVPEGEYTMLMKKIEILYGDSETGLNSINNSATTARKILRNGNLYIINDNKTYNILGYEIR